MLLDLSAVLDTIDYNTLLSRLQNYVGITGIALAWCKSYLSDVIHSYQWMKCYHIDHKYSMEYHKAFTRTTAFHALHVNLGRYHQET